MDIASPYGSVSSGHDTSPLERWKDGRAHLKLSDEMVRQRRYGEALHALDDAHNFGRDNIRIHAAAHFRYVRFSLRDKNYKRAAGHLYRTITSPILVPRDRKRRAEVAVSALK